MRITKIGHCCLLIEEQGLRILTDPGNYSSGQDTLRDIDVVLITHEHADHFHQESVQSILKNNPAVQIITNSAVHTFLAEKTINATPLTHGNSLSVHGVSFEAWGEKHAPIYETVPVVENTGYRIAGKLFYPGDAFTEPAWSVEILALPIAGPWMALSQAIDYAKKIVPRVAFPVHDGMLSFLGPVHRLPAEVLSKVGTQFKPLTAGDSVELL